MTKLKTFKIRLHVSQHPMRIDNTKYKKKKNPSNFFGGRRKIWLMPEVPALSCLREEECEFEFTLSYDCIMILSPSKYHGDGSICKRDVSSHP